MSMENTNYTTEDEVNYSETQSFLVQVEDEPSFVKSRNPVIYVFAVATIIISVLVIVIITAIIITASLGEFVLKV